MEKFYPIAMCNSFRQHYIFTLSKIWCWLEALMILKALIFYSYYYISEYCWFRTAINMKHQESLLYSLWIQIHTLGIFILLIYWPKKWLPVHFYCNSQWRIMLCYKQQSSYCRQRKKDWSTFKAYSERRTHLFLMANSKILQIKICISLT